MAHIEEEYGKKWDLGPWHEKPENVELYYPVQDIGPPLWIEQQRVLQTFWRIQLSHDMKAALLASRNTWPEVSENPRWRNLDKIEPANLWYRTHLGSLQVKQHDDILFWV